LDECVSFGAIRARVCEEDTSTATCSALETGALVRADSVAWNAFIAAKLIALCAFRGVMGAALETGAAVRAGSVAWNAFTAAKYIKALCAFRGVLGAVGG